jgi:hypothetical protein
MSGVRSQESGARIQNPTLPGRSEPRADEMQSLRQVRSLMVAALTAIVKAIAAKGSLPLSDLQGF